LARRRFSRPLGERRYKRMFVLATEGAETEPRYFKIFEDGDKVIHVQLLKGGHKSSPPQVLKRMDAYLRKEGLRPEDEAWLVVDTDQWTELQLQQLYQWGQTKENYGLAVSNPQFEFWLLLHFEDGNGVRTSRECVERLLRQIPGYQKGAFDAKQFASGIANAVDRARRRDTPPCQDWPRDSGTTVYRLIERLTA